MTTPTPTSINSKTHENDAAKVSVGVGRGSTSVASPKQQVTSITLGSTSVVSPKQQATSITVGDEYKYVGDIYAEKKHGNGILSWSDGRTYTGAFFADKRHGFGSFQTPDVLEFKGLYRNDERFGPGILIYKSIQSADVGFWLSDDLVRLLYPHPILNLDVHITDKKSSIDSTLVIPSWYSPEELLSTVIDPDFILKKKPSALFCNKIENENSFLTHYLIEHSNRIQEVMHDKCAQVNAYLNNENILKDKILNERIADILSPNETYEQRQLYYYINKFLPLKQRATFPIDEILSNTRSAFPNPGPRENSSLTLFESSFDGQSKSVRDILMHHQVYVDVCDSRGLTALHFATYNVHINVVNVLLDFGANVNQFSDDGLTPLAIAFLLYYGNNPQQTINSALEHSDPVLLNPRSAPVVETRRRSSTKDRLLQQSRTTANSIGRGSVIDEDKILIASSMDSIKINEIEKKNSYGYELTNELCERIQNEQFRESVCSLIKLLLRRGADPSLSDWPLPVLALAVRAGDKEMVELLLKKKAQVNCRLNATRHVHLTPLHIACGSSAPNAVDIVQQLLKYGAEVNAETLSGGKEYLSLADPVVLDLNKITETQEHGRTPLHIACTREATSDTLSIVRLLLQHQANPNAVCNGQTPLSLAIAMGNKPLVDLLLDHETTDPSTVLGYGNGNALCSVLSTTYEPRWTYAKRLELIERLIAKNPKVLYPIRFGPKNTLGSSVDYAYYSYFADPKISQTPYHSLSPQERVIYKERKDLLAYIAKVFREEVVKHEDFLRLPTPTPDDRTPTPGELMLLNHTTVSRARSLMTDKTPGDIDRKESNEFHYCATCGRSTGVRLTLCKRCQKVCFCSKACKVSGWNDFHRYECQTPNESSPEDRPITTIPSKMKLPSIRADTLLTEATQFQSMGTSGTRFENFTALDSGLFKENALLPKTTPQHRSNNNKSRLPNLTAAKLIRQKRLKKIGQSKENLPPTLPASLGKGYLSWNYMYNGPENYSFN